MLHLMLDAVHTLKSYTLFTEVDRHHVIDSACTKRLKGAAPGIEPGTNMGWWATTGSLTKAACCQYNAIQVVLVETP